MLCPCGTYAHGGGMNKLEELKKARDDADAAYDTAWGALEAAKDAREVALEAAKDAREVAFDVWKAADNAYEAALKGEEKK